MLIGTPSRMPQKKVLLSKLCLTDLKSGTNVVHKTVKSKKKFGTSKKRIFRKVGVAVFLQ
jgi:hypothetical protein